MRMQVLAVAVGGAIGALSRFLLAQKIHHWFGAKFPYGILMVNVLGCLLMGILAIWLMERFSLAPVWRAGILIGFLGAFTTFSSFSLDTLNLFERGAISLALLYVLLSVILCLFATWLGMLIGRSL